MLALALSFLCTVAGNTTLYGQDEQIDQQHQTVITFVDSKHKAAVDLERVKEKIIRTLSKSLQGPSQTHPVLILLGGYVGSGKTTLATALKKQYNLTLFSLNAIRQAMLDEGLDIRTNKQEERAILFDVYPKLLSPCLARSSHIVIDANANAQGIQEVMRFLKEHKLDRHYQVIKIHLHASQEELFKRVQARTHLAHLHQGTAQDLEYELKTPSKALHPEDYDLSIDTENTPFEEELKKVQALLNPFLE